MAIQETGSGKGIDVSRHVDTDTENYIVHFASQTHLNQSQKEGISKLINETWPSYPTEKLFQPNEKYTETIHGYVTDLYEQSIIAYCSLSKMNPDWNGTHPLMGINEIRDSHWHLTDVAVDQNWRGRGVAKTMMEELVNTVVPQLMNQTEDQGSLTISVEFDDEWFMNSFEKIVNNANEKGKVIFKPALEIFKGRVREEWGFDARPISNGYRMQFDASGFNEQYGNNYQINTCIIYIPDLTDPDEQIAALAQITEYPQLGIELLFRLNRQGVIKSRLYYEKDKAIEFVQRARQSLKDGKLKQGADFFDMHATLCVVRATKR